MSPIRALKLDYLQYLDLASLSSTHDRHEPDKGTETET